MAKLFEEIDTQPSEIGEISLRKRTIPSLGEEPIYEVKLGDEFLMSSMFVDAEVALSTLGLAATKKTDLKVVVGGLGLGYTAVAALEDSRISELFIVDFLQTVIRWHEQEKVPLGKILNADPRSHYIHGSFFDLAISDKSGFNPSNPKQLFDVILLDIDHSPTDFLNQSNAGFYTTENLYLMARQLHTEGVFAMWSQDLPDKNFIALLETVFCNVQSHIVTFFNPFQNREATNTVYTGLKIS